MATFPQIAFTNLETSARTGVFRCLVPWSTGDIASLSYLRANKQIEFDGVNRDVYWTTFGPNHRDGSVRWSVAEFEATIPAGATTRTAPDVIATVVDGANTTPTPDFTEFDAYWATTDINVSYVDARTGTGYAINLLTAARAGANNATYTETTDGMRKIIRAEAYFGRGRHYELERVGGFGTNTAAVETQGNLHVRLWFEVSSGQRWGTGTIQFVADAQYPHPSLPPDDGTSRGDPGRQTRLDPAAGEELEEPLTFEFDNGIQVQFTNSANSTPEYMSPRLYYVQNVDTGISCWGDHPAIDAPNRQTFRMGLYGLGDMQGWPFRFSLAYEAQGRNTWDQAYQVALRPMTYVGLPTHDTWMDTVRTLNMPAPYSSDTASIKGGWEMPLQECSQALLDQWYSEGPSRYSAMLNQNYGPLTWQAQQLVRRNGTGALRTWEWQMLGRKVSPPGPGAQPQLGMFREGRAWLANSPWDLCIMLAHTTREIGGARQGFAWKQENQPSLWDGVDLDASAYWTGTEFHWTSRDCKGRWKDHDLNSSRSNYRLSGVVYEGAGSHYAGQTAAWENPSWVGLDAQGVSTLSELTAFQNLIQSWDNWDHAHFGMRIPVATYLLTQDPFLLDMIENTAVILEHRQVPTNYFGANPGDSTTRAEARIARGQYHAWLLTGKERYREAVRRRLTQYTTGSTSRSSPLVRWNQWPVLASTDSKARTWPCDNTPETARIQQSPIYVPWQTAHFVVFAISMAGEWADLYPTETGILANIIRYGITTNANYCFMAGPGNLSGAATAIDGCWDHVRMVRAGNPGEIAALDGAQYGCGRFYYVNAQDAGPWEIQADITRDVELLLPSNGGENQDNYPAMLAYEIFADFRADTDLAERCEFFAQRMAAWLSIGPQNHDDNTTKGYASDRWVSLTWPAPSPRLTVTPRAGLTPLTVSFDASASVIGGVRSSAIFRWWFDYDGSSTTPDVEGSLASNPNIETQTYTYTAAGAYRVRLQIEDSAGQTSELDLRDHINAESSVGAAPVAAFSADLTSGTAPLEVPFFDQSTGNPTAWMWTFEEPTTGDRQTSTDQDPIVVFPAVGFYDVTLQVSSVWGSGITTKTGYITVSSSTAPQVAFTVSPATGTVPPDLTITFDNQTTNATLYHWDFGDGTSSTAEEPGTHDYTTAGTYIIVLTAWNTIGEVGQASYTLTVTVTTVQQDATVALGSGLFALSRQFDPSTTSGSSGKEVILAGMITASAFTSGDDGSFATPTVNPGVTFEMAFDDGDTANALMFSPTAGVTSQSATVAIGDGQFPSSTQYGPTVYVDGTHVEVKSSDMITATAAQHAPTVIAGTGRTVRPGPVFTTASQHDPTGQVIVDRDIELGMIQTASSTYSVASGIISKNVQASAQFASATQDAPTPSINGSATSPTYQSGTAVMFSPAVSGNVTAAADITILRGSLEAAEALTGSV